MSRADYTAEEILRELDACARTMSFPMLDNGYIYLGDARMSVYADAARWALVFEVLGYHYKHSLPRGFGTGLFACGSGFTVAAYRAGSVGGLSFVLTPGQGSEFWDDIPASQEAVEIRGRRVAIPRDPSAYAAKGIEVEDTARIGGQDLLRVLLPEHREGMLATEEERRALVPPDLPLFARLDEWCHPDISGDELPSGCPTFQSLAAAMAEREPNRFRLTKKPNTHWRNWPMGGAL